MIGRPALLVVALAFVIMTAPATAQSMRNTDDVVVTGKAAPPIEITRDILRAITPRTAVREQMPRLFDPACIVVGGLKEPIARAIADRVATNAAEAGLKLARPNCQANVLIFVASDGKAQAQDVLRRQSYFFGSYTPTQISRFTDAAGPVRMFSAISMASRDGDRPDNDGTLPTAENLELGFDAPTLKLFSSSRMGPAVRRVVSAVILVIDRAALVGRTPVQIGDYATMRALAGASYKADAGNETIVSLLEKGATPPAQMTKIDRALLVQMYHNDDLRSVQAEINAAARVATRD